MKKFLAVICLCCLMLVMLTACGGSSEPAAETVAEPVAEPAVDFGNLGAQDVAALTGTFIPGGTTLQTNECAIMLSYIYHGASQEEIESYAQDAGYVPIATSGEGEKVYALMPGEDSFTAVVLGEADTLHPSVESGGSRRFAERYVLWETLSGADWKVDFVEEQDYYELDGNQYPCYMIGMSAAE